MSCAAGMVLARTSQRNGSRSTISEKLILLPAQFLRNGGPFQIWLCWHAGNSGLWGVYSEATLSKVIRFKNFFEERLGPRTFKHFMPTCSPQRNMTVQQTFF